MRIHLVDGTFELFRSHFSPGPDRLAPDGRDVKAAVGVASALVALLDDADEAVTHLAVAFDNPIESWRNVRFADYKDSSGIDPAILGQFDLVERLVAAMGITVWSMDEHEADDALASAAVQSSAWAEQVRILTPDKDLAQVVDGDHIVQVDRMRRREFNEDGVIERLGVAPTSVPDYLGLVGDTADGIPGLPRFGAKGVATLLGRYPHLEDIPRDGDWDVDLRGAAGLQATFVERYDDAVLYRELATLALDVALDVRPETMRVRSIATEAFEQECLALGATSLWERASHWPGPNAT